MSARVVLALLGLVPAVAAAQDPFTLKCAGEETVWGGPDGETHAHLVKYYTLHLHGKTGRFYDWNNHAWSKIFGTDAHTIYLGREVSATGREWHLSIDRGSGEWHEDSAGGQHSAVTSGRCIKVPLREPDTQRQSDAQREPSE